jgi:hypothetical protein
MKICRQNPDLVKIGYKCWALYMKILVRFIIAGDINLVIKALSWREMVSGCYDCERATMLRYTYIAWDTYFCPVLVMYINTMQGNSSLAEH